MPIYLTNHLHYLCSVCFHGRLEPTGFSNKLKEVPIPFIKLYFYKAIHGSEISSDKLKLIISQLTEKVGQSRELQKVTYENFIQNVLFLLKTYICALIHSCFNRRPRPFLWVWACWLHFILFLSHSISGQGIPYHFQS